MSKKTPPFDPVQTAVQVRQRQVRLHTLTIEQQLAVRQELRSSGALRTKLLRRGNGTPDKASTLAPTARFREAYSS